MKPPFSTQLLTVTEVDVNRITTTDGTTTRVRNKNQLKGLAAHLQTSSRRSDNATSVEEDTLIMADTNVVRNESNRILPLAPTKEPQNLFTLQPEVAPEMKGLLANAGGVNGLSQMGGDDNGGGNGAAPDDMHTEGRVLRCA